MKRYIKLTYIIFFSLIATIVLSAAFLTFYNTKLADIKRNLKMTAEVIRISGIPPNKNLIDYTSSIAGTDKNLRVTIINSKGIVVGDSQAQISDMDNHLNRIEVDQAIKNGFGEDIRKSHTTGIKTIYIAAKIDQDIILRLSYPLAIIYEFLKGIIPLLTFLLIIMISFINIFANSFSQKLLLPLKNINKLLETKQQEHEDQETKIKSFKEVDPILNNIDYLVRKLHYDFAEMEKTQQMRTDFVANVSHELKSPLTSIKGFAELISSGLITTKDKQDDYLKRIVNESDRLLVIINDILRLSEAESVKVDREALKFISLDEIANNVIKALESLGTEKHIMMFVTGQASIKALKKDMWELIYNLVDNGIRYGKKNGFVQIKIEDTNDGAVLTVQDDGIGIEKDQLSRIFERFYRVDSSRSRKSGGTGLGLSIVRNIAIKYGATVTVDSSKGDGATFTIKFTKE